MLENQLQPLQGSLCITGKGSGQQPGLAMGGLPGLRLQHCRPFGISWIDAKCVLNP